MLFWSFQSHRMIFISLEFVLEVGMELYIQMSKGSLHGIFQNFLNRASVIGPSLFGPLNFGIPCQRTSDWQILWNSLKRCRKLSFIIGASFNRSALLIYFYLCTTICLVHFRCCNLIVILNVLTLTSICLFLPSVFYCRPVRHLVSQVLKGAL